MEYYTIKEVAERMRVHERTVKNWIQAGKFEAFREGNVWRISAASFDAYVERQTVGGKAEQES